MADDMKTTRINAGAGYDVMTGENLIDRCGELIASRIHPEKIALVTDCTVAGLYLERAKGALCRAGFEVSTFVFPAGESEKSMKTLAELLEFLAGAGLSRTDCVAALGGGVTGDLAGFAAGCYMRGIALVGLPTTLLSAVDSSVGGKTAVDLTAGKNLAGVFHQPSAVICSTDTLKSLPSDTFAEGAAEAIKTGMLSGGGLFEIFESGRPAERLSDIISACVSYKGGVVERDERESGERKLLNLGHTPAHAIEALSGFSVSHGKAVAMGLAIMTRAAEALGYASEPLAERVLSTLKRNGLPAECPYGAKELAEAAFSDKKRSGTDITVILPRRIGLCTAERISMSGLEGVFAAGLEKK